MEKVRLGINIDHVATLRQVRGNTTSYPDLIHLMNLAIKGGAEQITIHLREDRRHIKDEDVKKICKTCSVDVNLEMACTEEMTKIALKNRPDWICVVPEKREELTTEGGLNIEKIQAPLVKLIGKVQNKGIEVSLFLEPNIKHVKLAYQLGADAIEFHTGKWVKLNDKKRKDKEFLKLCEAAKLCQSLGMRVHAGHGLDYDHTKKILEMPFLRELNIGHSVICYSLEMGIEKVVRQFKKNIQKRI